MKRKIYEFMKSPFFATILLLFAYSTSAQNLLNNGSFESDDTDWIHLAQNGSAATFTIETSNAYEGDKFLRAEVTTLGANAYDVQSIHAGWTALAGTDYKITIAAKADSNGRLIRLINQNSNYLNTNITLTNTWATYTWNVTLQETAPQFKIHFFQKGVFDIDNIVIQQVGTVIAPKVNDSLKTLGANCGLYMGTAVADGPLQSETNYINTVKQQYNMVVSENSMKMDAIKPTETGAYNFDAADRLINFAQTHGMQVRGHTLLWHSQLPGWVENKVWTRESLLDFLKTYIQTVVGRYKGKIQEWDVANECIDDISGNPLRNSVWFNVVGVEVLDSAFKWTHQVDPDAKLYYNDYSAETMNTKSMAVYNLVKGLKERGAPIYGVGFQMHRNWNEATTMGSALITQMGQNIDRISALNLKVAITELDLGINTPTDAAKLNDQAKSYGNILQLVLNKKPVIETFVTWGFTDKYSWIPNFSQNQRGDALVFDNNYAPKAGFNQLITVLSTNCPSTNLTDHLEIQGVKIYPNPFQESLTVYMEGEFEYNIFNAAGINCENGIGSSKASIGTNLPKGIYIMKIQKGDLMKTFKVQKN